MRNTSTTKFNSKIRSSLLIALIMAFFLASSSLSIDISNCPSNCNACNNSNECTECKSGYRITSSKQCEACSESGCGQCDGDKDVCKSCAGGHYASTTTVGLSGTQVTCAECPDSHCFECDAGEPATCKRCDPGFEVNGDADCEISKELLKILLLYVALPLFVILLVIMIACCSCKTKKKSTHYHYHDKRQVVN